MFSELGLEVHLVLPRFGWFGYKGAEGLDKFHNNALGGETRDDGLEFGVDLCAEAFVKRAQVLEPGFSGEDKTHVDEMFEFGDSVLTRAQKVDALLTE